MNRIINKLYRLTKEYNINIEYDIFSYGFDILLKYLTVLIIVLIFTYINKTYWETIIFLTSFIYLRKYCGGFHLHSDIMCLTLSIVVSLIIPYLSTTFFPNNIFNYFVISLFLIIFLKIGPQDCQNKQLSIKEKIHYKKLGICVLFMEFFLSVLIQTFLPTMSNAIIFSVFLNLINISIANLLKFLIK